MRQSIYRPVLTEGIPKMLFPRLPCQPQFPRDHPTIALDQELLLHPTTQHDLPLGEQALVHPHTHGSTVVPDLVDPHGILPPAQPVQRVDHLELLLHER